MPRLISVEWALASASSGLVRTIDGEKWIRVSEVRESIRNAPTVDAEPVRHGRWIYNEKPMLGNAYGSYYCSECGAFHPHRARYCPYCGADMREVENAEID